MSDYGGDGTWCSESNRINSCRKHGTFPTSWTRADAWHNEKLSPDEYMKKRNVRCFMTETKIEKVAQ